MHDSKSDAHVVRQPYATMGRLVARGAYHKVLAFAVLCGLGPEVEGVGHVQQRLQGTGPGGCVRVCECV